eukprot:gene7628-786_t
MSPACLWVQVFNVPGRCFPVDIIHTKEDHQADYSTAAIDVDYSTAAIDVIMQIHLDQPEGTG